MTVRPTALSASDCAAVSSKSGLAAPSPSSNPCVVKLAGRRRMFNPYRGLGNTPLHLKQWPAAAAAAATGPAAATGASAAATAAPAVKPRIFSSWARAFLPSPLARTPPKAQQQHQQQQQQQHQPQQQVSVPACPVQVQPQQPQPQPQAFALAVPLSQQQNAARIPLPFAPAPVAAHYASVPAPATVAPKAVGYGNEQQHDAPYEHLAYDILDSVSTPTASSAAAADVASCGYETASALGATVRCVVVQFKLELCTYQSTFRVSEGDYVVVEADRGEHVGRVHRVLDEPPAFHVPSRILRRASETEVALIADARSREGAAAARIQEMAHELRLPLRIVDAEIYTDGSKMTVFFAAKGHVDFRQLQRNLFREFHRRIWLINYAEVQYRNRNFRNRK